MKKCIALLFVLFFTSLCIIQLQAQHSNGFNLSEASVSKRFISQGGVKRDGIPPIYKPRFVVVSAVKYLADDDRVLGVVYNGKAKAYPIKIMNYHEVVNDWFGDTPIVVTYCPLCGSGLSFLATVEGRHLTFGTSGMVYNSDVLLYDRESNSLWSQIKAEAITGKHKGTRLTMVSSTLTTWAQWQAAHPETQVLSINTGYRRPYDEEAYKAYEASNELMFPVAHRSYRYHQKMWVIGIEINGQAQAFPFKELAKKEGPLITRLGGQAITVHYNTQGNNARITNENGEELPAITCFWFAWKAFYPETEVFKAKK